MMLIKQIGYLTATIVLLYFAWPPHQFGPLILVAFIPLLYYINSVRKFRAIKRFSLIFLGLFVSIYSFGYLVSMDAWGEYGDSVRDGVFISVFPKAFIVSFAAFIRRRKWLFLFIILSWASVEVLQTYWEFNAPLLMIGNSLSNWPVLIQHYSIWGVLGGTMMILAVNVVIFYIIQYFPKGLSVKRFYILLSILLLPTFISILSFYRKSQAETMKLAIAVGHFDHFKSEFSNDPMLLVNKYNNLLSRIDLDSVDLVVFPESAVVNGGWIDNLNDGNFQNPLDSLCPSKEVFFGSHLFSSARGDEKDHYSARSLKGTQLSYLSHNCIVFRNNEGHYTLRSKEKYIPFHESIPYPGIFSFARNWYSKDAEPTFLTRYRLSHDESFITEKGIRISPLMCFESTFTDMALRNPDADFILVLANESWNDQIRGKKQYMTYLNAKAIESGKTILKVSNGGISGMINSKGEVEYQFGFNEPLVKLIEVKRDRSHSIYSSIRTPFSWVLCLGTIVFFLWSGISQRNKQ